METIEERYNLNEIKEALYENIVKCIGLKFWN